MNLESINRSPDENDGDIQLVVGAKEGRVVIDFCKQIKWIALEPEQAVMLAQMMIQCAIKTSKKPLQIKVKISGTKLHDGMNGQTLNLN